MTHRNPQLDIESKTIRDREYRMSCFGFREWARLSAEVAQISGPGAELATSLFRGNSVGIGKLVYDIATGLMEGLGSGLLDRVCAHVEWNTAGAGEKARWLPLRTEKQQDAVWAGNYAEGVLVLAWILWRAYQGFFSDAGGLVSELCELLELDEAALESMFGSE